MTEQTLTDEQTPQKTKRTRASHPKSQADNTPEGDTSAIRQEGAGQADGPNASDGPDEMTATPKKRAPRKKSTPTVAGAAAMPDTTAMATPHSSGQELPPDVLVAIQSLSQLTKDNPDQAEISLAGSKKTAPAAKSRASTKKEPAGEAKAEGAEYTTGTSGAGEKAPRSAKVAKAARSTKAADKKAETDISGMTGISAINGAQEDSAATLEKKPTPKRPGRKKATPPQQESLLVPPAAENLPALALTPILPAVPAGNIPAEIPVSSYAQETTEQNEFTDFSAPDSEKTYLPSHTPLAAQADDDSLFSILSPQEDNGYPRNKRRRSRRKRGREDGYTDAPSPAYTNGYTNGNGNGGRGGNIAQRNTVPSGLTPLDFPQAGPSPFGPKETQKVRGENQTDFPALLASDAFDHINPPPLPEDPAQPPLPVYFEDENSILGPVLHHAEEEQTHAVDDTIGNHAEKPQSQKADVDGNRLPQKPEKQNKTQKNLQPNKKEIPAEEEEKAHDNVKRVMYVSVAPSEQVEVVLTENGLITEYFLEMAHQAKIRGNIYKGVISNIDTNLQAAFVNFGAAKNGFLQIDEVHPEYWQSPHDSSKGYKLPLIQKVLKVGQEVLVQVVKEPAGSKGAFLTTWVTLAGRFLVLTPGQETIGVSRKVDDDAERNRLKELLTGIDPGEDMGVIIRTASEGASKTTIQKDLQYLKRLWKDLRKRVTTEKAPCLIYEESDLSSRAVRDYLVEEMDEIWVDNEETSLAVTEMASFLFPRKNGMVRLHQDPRQTLWERFNLQKQLAEITSREVTLPSGGRIVFDQTEALMAIDINSGKVQGKTNFEAMVLRTNMEAAEAIARHLRLRDIGGQVVIDFIEMRDKGNIREVEKCMRNAMKNDRARHDVGHISAFGLMELVRQRTGTSAISISSEPCPHCNGTGVRRNLEWQALQSLRLLQAQLHNANKNAPFIFSVEPELALYLLNKKKDRLLELENRFGVKVEISLK